MKFEEFREKFNHSPIDDTEMAHAAACIEDDDDLRDAAVSFLAAQYSFHACLEQSDIEFG